MIKRRRLISQSTFDDKILQFVSSQISTVKNMFGFTLGAWKAAFDKFSFASISPKKFMLRFPFLMIRIVRSVSKNQELKVFSHSGVKFTK